MNKIIAFFGKPSLTQMELFARTLAILFKSGVTLVEALDIAADLGSGRFKHIISYIVQSVRAGSSFSRALSDHPKIFSSLFINTIRVGESSGTLGENLEYMAEQLHKQKQLASKIQGAVMYPSIILTASVGLGIFAIYFVLPKITPLFKSLKVDLPFTTKLLIWLSGVVEQYGFMLLLGFGIAVVGAGVLLKQKFVKPITHWIILQFPLISRIVKGGELSSASRVLGTILKSGIAIDEALGITKDTMGNYYYKRALLKVKKSVTGGGKLSDALSGFPRLFPKLLTRMVKTGEASGKLDETLLFVADYYEDEVDSAAKSLSAAIEPLLLLVIGLMVAFLALSIITPIFKVTSGIRGR